MIGLEALTDGSVSARNFEQLMALVIDTGGRDVGLRFGTGTATWTASVTSANVVVPHGLGRIPVAAFTGTRDELFGHAIIARDATNLTVRGFITHNVAVTATRTFDWLVIG